MLERLTTDSVLHHQSHVFSFSFSERIPSHDLLFDDQDDDVKEKKRRIVRKIGVQEWNCLMLKTV